jgi:hypothetical protein
MLHAVVEDAVIVVLPAVGVFSGDCRWLRGATIYPCDGGLLRRRAMKAPLPMQVGGRASSSAVLVA